jgi:hypothetical protein
MCLQNRWVQQVRPNVDTEIPHYTASRSGREPLRRMRSLERVARVGDMGNPRKILV